MARGGRNVNYGSSASVRLKYNTPQKQLHLGRLWRPVAWLAFAVFLFYVVFFSPLLKIEHISVSGNKQLTSAEISSQLSAMLDSSFLGRSSLFVNTSALEKRLKQANYQIGQVSISRSWITGLSVSLVEQEATIQWRSGSSVFVLSGAGKAYTQVDKLNKALPLVEDSTNLPVTIGQQVVPSSFVEFTTEVSKALKAASIGVSSIQVPETTSELYVKTDKGYVIKFDTTRDVGSQMSDYRSVVAKPIAPKEYIDLRIAGKVFYR